MIIRVTTGTFDPAREADVQRWGEERLVPAMRALPGFRGYHGGFDTGTGRLVGVSFWGRREQAEALREHLDDVLGELAGLGGQLAPGQTFEETLTA